MTASALLAYTVILAGPAAWILRRAGWAYRAPQTGIVAWLALSLSVVGGPVLLGLVLLAPRMPFSTDLVALLHACVTIMRGQYAAPGGEGIAAVGGALAIAVAARVGYSLVATAVRLRSERRRHLDMLTLAGRPDARLQAVIVDHATAAAYCVPGPGSQVVLTSAALAALAPDELKAVLEHERAHLRERHHLVIGWAVALERAFPFVPAFRWARTEIAGLVEMLADDAASRCADRRTLARALVTLADGGAPAEALAAGGATAVARVQRLLTPARPLGRVRTAVACLSIAAVLALPLLVAAAPAVAAAAVHYCPLPELVPPLAGP
jgi:Zn-dependent protease with chaperone function